MRRLFLLTLLILWAQLSQAQEIDLEKFVERLFQVQGEDVAYEDIYESLLLFYTDPLNLNTATSDELASLFILSPVQLDALLDHRDQFGDLLSIYELQAVPYFDIETIEQLLPFVTINEQRASKAPFVQRFLDEPNKYFLLRTTRILEAQRGYDPEEENGYRGSPEKIYGRFRASSRGDFSVGFTFEKDAGEALNEEGFDFVSGHLLLENQGPFRSIMIGDFQIQAGQGLVFGSGFNPGKGAETVNTVKRNTLGVRPYTSVLETGFFRGISPTVSLGKVDLTAFVSSLKQDGRVQEGTSEDQFEAFANSIQISGLHRTKSEISSKNQVLEHNFGGIMTFKPNRKMLLGMTALATRFDTPILPLESAYRRFDFQGNLNQVGSAFGNYQLGSLNFFAEAARSSSGGVGIIGGVLASLSRSFDVAISLRNYAKDFHSFYGNGFGETSGPQNEKGIYWGLKYQPSRKYSFVAYYDKFSFPWLRFGVDAPSHGAEWLSRFTYRPTREITLFAQVREEGKEVSLDGENLSNLVQRVRRNYLFDIDYELNKNFSIRTRLQSSNQNLGGVFSSGYALIQDAGYRMGKFRLNARIALFETDDFDNRQYVYELDVLYAFSIPAYNGIGVRNYLLLRYSASRKLDFWFRYARFSYRDRDTVGSGLEESNGPFRTEIKWMIRWKMD